MITDKEFESISKSIGDDILLQKTLLRLKELDSLLDELEKLPKINVNPNNPMQQKTTPAAKMYKEYIQQFLNGVKLLSKVADTSSEEESPLRKWVKSRNVN